MSQQERVSWVSLVVTAVVGVWYFARVLALPADSPLFGPGMVGFTVALVLVAIAVGTASELALRWLQKRGGGDPARREGLDERDRLINLRAGRNAYVVLAFSIALVLGLIVTRPFEAAVIARWLLLALTLASLCRYATRIASYRRGY